MIVKRLQSFFSVLTTQHRVELWVLLIILTVAILIFPTHLHYEYRPVESPYIFQNLPLFAALYCVWLAILLLLIFSLDDRKSRWQGMILAAIFGLVYLGFWTIVAPGKTSDGLSFATSVKSISTGGKLSGNIVYGEFPGLLLLTSILQQVTRLEVIGATEAIVVIIALLLAALLYLLMSKSLQKHSLAAFGVLLLMQGTWILSRINYFAPSYLGLTLIAGFLVLVSGGERGILGGWHDRVLAIILLAVATMTHLPSSILMFFVLLGLYLVQAVNRRWRVSSEITPSDRVGTASWSTLLLFLVIPLTWELYYAYTTFGRLVGYIPTFIQDLTRDRLFGYASTTSSANLGGAIPLWTNATRWFWLVFVYAFGLILGLRSLVRIRRLSSVEVKKVGVLIGIGLFCTMAFVLSPGGEQGQRFLLYLPLVLLPITLMFLLNLGDHIRKYALGIVAILFFILSFPTFLAHNSMISTDAFYPQDFAAGNYVKSVYSNTEYLTVFSGGLDTATATYYQVPDAHYYFGASYLVDIKDANAVWEEFDKMLTRFNNSETGRRIFLFSVRTKTPYQHIFGIKPTDPKWQEIEERLQNGNKIYDNGQSQIYQPAREQK